MQYGLFPQTVADIQQVLRQFPQVERAVLYGSRAKGNYRPGSDIDLTLKGEMLNLKLINSISLELDELYLPYNFDLSVWSQIDNAALRKHIERVGVVFYAREAVAG